MLPNHLKWPNYPSSVTATDICYQTYKNLAYKKNPQENTEIHKKIQINTESKYWNKECMKIRLLLDFSSTMPKPRRQRSNSSRVLRAINSEPLHKYTIMFVKAKSQQFKTTKNSVYYPQTSSERVTLQCISAKKKKKKRIHTEKVGYK